MTGRESEVPLDLQHSFLNADVQMNWTKVIDLMLPEECPDCPECGQRLDVVSVGVDGPGNLTAAKLMCRNHAPLSYYVYEEATDEVYFAGHPERVEPPAFERKGATGDDVRDADD